MNSFLYGLDEFLGKLIRILKWIFFFILFVTIIEVIGIYQNCKTGEDNFVTDILNNETVYQSMKSTMSLYPESMQSESLRRENAGMNPSVEPSNKPKPKKVKQCFASNGGEKKCK